MDKVRIAVIGAGVVGLSTAVCIVESIPNCSVTVIAEKFTPNTTSDIAAGILSPHFSPETPIHCQKRWFGDTFAHVLSIGQSADAPIIGVEFLSGWEIFKEPPKERFPFWSDMVLGFRTMTDVELRRFTGAKFGWMYTTLICECISYLPWLEKRLKDAGGQLQAAKIQDFWELDGQYDIIVNCCGIGAKALTGDPKIHPVRGQVHKVHAPWLKHFIRTDDGRSYIYPGISSVVVGGTRQNDDWRMSVDPFDSKDIFERCCALEPTLKHSSKLFEAVGLRPARAVLRLEKEKLERRGRQMCLVHNYGHGGAGVSFHWGTAKEAAELVKDFVIEMRPTGKYSKSKL
ncbi:D-aspartate oxidase isoform X2 [Callorhinchus milii]|uniref:D-aspartate oxidase n=2 Tax=Callorhinchus milii TaxID=7868 RepID=V9KMJ6_CALMI|nr:D-aspartate oxidase isoform X2 [Callorhinchus milii]XP_007892168.1 D-aspartate oxidase isoform X2 [Callorhinchus milii]XP_007892169.1 D-aspartate oxidase isoform X2 [Callorhinchus milii]XP_007892170.1 D-aspartate oxidase isoform X2 [Callorhinchus milii]XP_042189178.1 D-aspartate oxidase isoform X2 [Callorhinchus milii]|eukprot:gi/632953016/ref/XP_007892165.1/ PREDICTED: D-aspartate oxidase isoform X2 [Callorhinchus milii]